ncbi:phage major capsid protein [Zavarzinella formosa]|uniref:phage major capsid protein n=1 Tax=Zavarzinella formosa TaxID=360055 RepID=UPI0012FAD411|nr:phage major capsid protein [Zavarzinella formosa]
MSVTELNALAIQRKGQIEKARAIFGRSESEGREMSDDEKKQFDAHMDDAFKLQEKAASLKAESEKNLARKSLLEAGEASLKEPRGRQVAPSQPFGQREGIVYRGRRMKQTAEQARRSGDEYKAAYNAYLADFTGQNQFSAALQTDVAEKGGYLAPTEMLAEVLKTIDNTFWFRKLANVLPPTSAPSITWNKRNGRIKSFAWGAEIAPPAKDANLKFGRRTMTPHYMTGEIDVSNDLLMSAIVDVDQFVVMEIGFGAGDLEEQAFFVGDGIGKPIGAFTPHANGITTARDKATAAVDQAALVSVKYSLREPYLRDPSLRWVGSRQFLMDCANLKSTQNEPLWLISLRDGQPDLLLGTPITMSEYAPTGSNAGAWQTGDYQAAIGAWSNYDIIDGNDMGIQRDESLMRRENQTAYIVRRKVDGCPRFEEAFARLKRS